MRGSWKALVYLVLAFEIPFLTVVGFFVGRQVDAAFGMPDANIFAGIGIVAGLYGCWVTFKRFRDFVEQKDAGDDDGDI